MLSILRYNKMVTTTITAAETSFCCNGGQVAGTVNGSSETTFYVLALYFGSIGIHRSRHAVLTGVLTDIAGVIFAVTAVRILLGGG